MARKRTYGTGRLCALTDGVFAIAITLLVLDLKLPENPDTPIAVSILNALPKFYSWIISFFALGILWLQHHTILAQLRRVDMTSLWLNLVLLLFVSVTPWTTSLLGTYHHQQPLAVVIFSGGLGLAWLAMSLMWLHAVYRGHLRPEITTPEPGPLTTLVAIRGSLIALLSIALAYLNTDLAVFSWLLLFVLQPFVSSTMSSWDEAKTK